MIALEDTACRCCGGATHGPPRGRAFGETTAKGLMFQSNTGHPHPPAERAAAYQSAVHETFGDASL
jgi:hypothetical protein